MLSQNTNTKIAELSKMIQNMNDLFCIQLESKKRFTLGIQEIKNYIERIKYYIERIQKKWINT